MIGALLFGASLFAASIGNVTVGVTETELLPARFERTSLIIGNPASNANTVYIKYDASPSAVTISNGTALAPGATLAIMATSAANPARNRITAISTSPTAVTVSEDDSR